MGVFTDRHFLFSSHPSVDRRFASLPPSPPLHPFIRDHYLGPIMTSIIFCYCSVYRVMAGRGLEYRGCSLAPRRIIRCRYAITTFASAKWKALPVLRARIRRSMTSFFWANNCVRRRRKTARGRMTRKGTRDRPFNWRQIIHARPAITLVLSLQGVTECDRKI